MKPAKQNTLQFYCPACGEIQPLNMVFIIPGMEIVCPECGTKFRIGFTPIEEEQ